MNGLRVLQARWLGVFRKEQLAAELDEELRFHLAMRTEENIARGMSREQAARVARREFGNVELVKDACRDVIGGRALEAFLHDLRFAWRMLAKDRASSATAVVALALGIGANTALFTVARSVLLRPLPFPAPAALMSIWLPDEVQADRRMIISYPDFLDYRARNRSFERLGGYRAGACVVAGGEREAEQLPTAFVTSEMFDVLGVQPAAGRTFTPAEDEPGARAVVISDKLWRERFAGQADALGATLTLDGRVCRVIGVMPAEFQFPIQNDPVQVWTTFASVREPVPGGGPAIANHRDAHLMHVVGRLRAGVSRREAAAEMDAIAAQLAAEYPVTNKRYTSARLTPWLSDITRAVRPPLLMLIGAAACLLCVACANVANLLLARASTRLKEMAIRSALGAGRRRVMRQMLTESLLLALLGGSLGLVFALAGTYSLVSMLPADFPRAREIGPDAWMLGFSLTVTLCTSCACGLAPAWRAARARPATVLNDCSRGSGETRKGLQARHTLVVAEMILALVLLASAGFLLHALWQLQRVQPGFDSRRLHTALISLPDSREADAGVRAVAFYDEFLRQLDPLTGIDSAAVVYPLPFTAVNAAADFEIVGRSGIKAEWPRARTYTVSSGYFETMQIPVKKGRGFDARDTRGSVGVAIINETLARLHFPRESPIGKRIRSTLTEDGVAIEREIVGVVGDVKSTGLAVAQPQEIYLPIAQCAAGEVGVVIRSGLEALVVEDQLRDVLGRLTPEVPLYAARSMEDYIAADTAQPRLNSTLLAGFAALGVLLTAVGVYAVMSYAVAQRRHEIGIRIALGAQTSAVFRLVFGEGVRLIGWAIGGGVLCSLVVAQLLRGLAAANNGRSAAIIAFASALVACMALLACWLPARRAAGEDPLIALGQR